MESVYLTLENKSSSAIQREGWAEAAESVRKKGMKAYLVVRVCLFLRLLLLVLRLFTRCKEDIVVLVRCELGLLV